MAQAGTLLSDLDGQQGGNDGDLVQKILSDMSLPPTTGRGPPPSAPPPLPQPQQMYQQQMGGSTAPITMDSRIPTAHIIGNEHPTPAQFASVVGLSGATSAGTVPGYAYSGAPPQQPMQQAYMPPQKNFYSRVMEELKIPFIVSLLFFVFSLSPVRVLVGHYLPSLLKPTGDFTVLGLTAIAGIVGAVFWLLHRVIAPLLSL